MARLTDAQREQARELRRDATDAERALWQHLRDGRLAGFRFRRQHPIGDYIADFACVEAKLVVEVDDAQPAASGRDRDRDASLDDLGWRVLRLWNHDVLEHPDAVAEHMLAHLMPSCRPSLVLRPVEGVTPSSARSVGEEWGGGLLRATVVARDGDTFDTITLDHEGRHRRRARLVSAGGLAFLLDLPHAVHLHDGDRLVLEDGRLIRVQAAAEPVLDVRAPDLARIAWHLGNRHTPTQVLADRLRLRQDHVLAHMLRGLGAEVTEAVAVFEPEHGAYHGHHDH